MHLKEARLHLKEARLKPCSIQPSSEQLKPGGAPSSHGYTLTEFGLRRHLTKVRHMRAAISKSWPFFRAVYFPHVSRSTQGFDPRETRSCFFIGRER